LRSSEAEKSFMEGKLGREKSNLRRALRDGILGGALGGALGEEIDDNLILPLGLFLFRSS
jgi:hypothetical protein